MTDREPPRLLVRERGQLDAVATPLGEGRRVVAFLVGDMDLWPVVRSYLQEKSGVAVPDLEAVTDPGRMLDLLTEAASLGPCDVRSIGVDHRVEDVLRTLNWHREKLRRGASVLVWIDGVEGLRALRAMAPDAYSFRDTMVSVTGEEHVEVRLPEADTLEIQLARIPYVAAESPIERAAAAVSLGFALLNHGSPESLRDLALEGLGEVSENVYADDAASTIRAGVDVLLMIQAMRRGELAAARSWARRGLAESHGTSTVEGRLLRVQLLTVSESPLRMDMSALGAAEDEALPFDPASWRFQPSLEAAERLRARGALRDALGFVDSAAKHPSAQQRDFAIVTERRASVHLGMGNVAAAEEAARAAASLRVDAHMSTLSTAYLLASCLRARGELDAARRLFGRLAASPAFDVTPTTSARNLAELRVDAGDVGGGLADLRVLIHEAAAGSRDGHLYEACASYVSALRDAHEAGRLSSQDLADADAELAVAERVALAIAGTDPPWYTILFPGLRAEIVALHSDRLDEAIVIAADVLARARAEWSEAVPMHARMHATHLVRASRLDEARDALVAAEAEASAQGHLRELARIQGLAIVVLARSRASAGEVRARVTALRATLDQTGAPRIVAESLLEVAMLLPPEGIVPDALDLLDEAHALFLEMPIVAHEARCLEAMGDVLGARGDRDGARARYLAAKAVLERHGLGLRLAVVAAKAEASGPAS